MPNPGIKCIRGLMIPSPHGVSVLIFATLPSHSFIYPPPPPCPVNTNVPQKYGPNTKCSLDKVFCVRSDLMKFP